MGKDPGFSDFFSDLHVITVGILFGTFDWNGSV